MNNIYFLFKKYNYFRLFEVHQEKRLTKLIKQGPKLKTKKGHWANQGDETEVK